MKYILNIAVFECMTTLWFGALTQPVSICFLQNKMTGVNKLRAKADNSISKIGRLSLIHTNRLV
ncbi:hypothetical protein FHS57_004209 [Runella defluvii]|uniref:Uncharacterized protein n=1 Tax=Runella defluvii TaxID=370973 RepID=A0A7W6ES69_9BACT|nr:hypothetical protein [Runella defluvii]